MLFSRRLSVHFPASSIGFVTSLRAFSFSLTDITSEKRVLLQKSIVAELIEILPAFYAIKTLIHVFTKARCEPNKSDLQPHTWSI
jgi:hypothetical protein